MFFSRNTDDGNSLYSYISGFTKRYDELLLNQKTLAELLT
jgi:hypothetical protein